MKPSRAMITGELSWAFLALATAWSGSGIWPFEETFFHAQLYTREYDYLWIAVIAIPAMGLLYKSGREHLAGRGYNQPWTPEMANKSAYARGRMCLALAFGWGYLEYTIVKLFDTTSLVELISFGGVFFCLWFWAENKRVQREYRKHNSLVAS